MIDTQKVKGRRSLRFESFDDVRADLEKLAQADRDGTLRHLGNWTPGTIFGHLAAFMSYPYDGFPPAISNPPWAMKMLLRAVKHKILAMAMLPGVRIPGIEGGTVATEDPGFDAGLARLLTMIDRLEATDPGVDGPLFGRMSHDQWRALNLRHCELHLSFLVP